MTRRHIQTDAEITERLRQNSRTDRLIDALAWEIRQGDTTSRKRAERDLRGDGLMAREVAAVKRHLKS
jgi:hypothetical protein